MNPFIFWLLTLLVIPASVVLFFASSRRSLLVGYLLGLVPIVLFWQFVSIHTLPMLKDSLDNHQREGAGLFFLLFYGYLFVGLIYYTGLSLSLRWVYRRVIDLTHIQARVRRILVAGTLAVLLGITWAVTILGSYLLISLMGGALRVFFFEWPVEIFPWLHYPVLKYGIGFFILVDGVILLLVLAWFLWRRRK